MPNENQTQPERQPAPQVTSQTPQASSSKPNEDLELSILKRLAKTLSYAVQTLDDRSERHIFVVFIPDSDAGIPEVTRHTTREDAATRLFALQQIIENNRNQDYYVLIFYGAQWQLVQGTNWKLHDGSELIPLNPQTVEDFVDPTGLIRNAPNLDDAVEEREPEEAEEGPEDFLEEDA